MNSELPCARCRHGLPEYATGALSTVESSVIEGHLAHCMECRHELDQWRTMVEMTHRAEALAPTGKPATLWSAIQAQISSESPVVSGEKLMEYDHRDSDTDLVTSRATPSRIDRGPRRRTTVMAVMAAVLLVTLGVTVFALRPQHTRGSGGSVSPTSTSTAVGFLPPSVIPNTVVILSANNMWAIATDPHAQPTPSSQIVHFDGQTWQASSNTFAGADLVAISMASTSDGWAVGTAGTDPNAKPLFLHYTGGYWVTVKTPNPAFRPNQVQMLSATDGWVFGLDGGNQAVLQYRDGAWNEVAITLPTQAPTLAMQPYSDRSVPHPPQFFAVQMFSDTEAWAFGGYLSDGFVWRLHNGQWSASYKSSSLEATAFGANSPADAWIVGAKQPGQDAIASGTGYVALRPTSSGQLALLHFDGNTWTTFQLPANLASYGLGSAFLDGARWIPAFMINGGGNIAELLRNQSGQWSVTSLPITIKDVVTIADQPDGSALALAHSDNNDYHLLRFANGTWIVVH